MTRTSSRLTTSVVLFFGLTAAAFAVQGEFGGMCTTGLAMHKQVQSDCSVNATYNGKTYCFGDQKAEVTFFKDPDTNLAKAEAYYRTIKK